MIFKIILLYSIFGLSLFAFNEQIINNPFYSFNESNIVNYTIILESNGVKKEVDNIDISIDKNLEKFFYDSYIYIKNFFICIEQSNKKYFLFRNNYYSIIEKDDKYLFIFDKIISTNNIYINYIRGKNTKSTGKGKNENGVTMQFDILLYGKKDEELCFNIISLKFTDCITLGNFDEHISCKLLKTILYICAYSDDGKIKLTLFSLLYNQEKIKNIYTNENSSFLNHDHATLYDTSDSDYKILCARKKDTSVIECSELSISYPFPGNEIKEFEIKYYYTNKDKYNAIFSYIDNNCNISEFKSEFLICCGNINIIKCERRNMDFQFINFFKIEFPGKITNLTIENSNNDFAKLIYNNISSMNEHIYEYHIFPPKCKNTNITLIKYHSYSLNLDDLFQRKTNTNYYIILKNLPLYYGKTYINEKMNLIGEKIKLNNEGNILYFISDKNTEVNNFEIKYEISIEETYSDLCSIFLTIKPCYHSCSNCTLSEENSNDNNHNCIECSPEYFPFPEGSSNCFKETEKSTSSEFKAQIMTNISYFINTANTSKAINGSDFIAVIMPSEDIDTKEQLKKGISAIELGNCTNVLKEFYNISQNESLYILNIESKRNVEENLNNKNDKSFNLGKNIQTEVYDKLGRKLDLSLCKQDIKIMKYIGDIDELDIKTAMNLATQGIDVFNANDDFFNDICQNFDNTGGRDIIIKDRRTDIYQNATFCQNGCSYTGLNIELNTANCICNSSFLESNWVNNNSNIENKENEDDNDTFKILTKSFIANLFDFNYEVIKCYNLVFNSNILHSNIGFYCMASMSILQIIFLFVFLIKGLNSLKLFMLIFNNYNQKLSISSPSPKNNKSNSNTNMLDNNKDKKIIETYNNKIKLSLKKIKEKKQFNLNDDTKYSKSNNKTKYATKYNHKLLKIKKTKLSHAEENEDNYNKNINCTPIINFKNSKFKNKKIILKSLKNKSKSKLYNITSNKKISFHSNKILNLYNMETIEGKNKNKIISKKNQDFAKLFKGDDDLQDMNYEKAILYDKRTYLRIYWSFLLDKQIILGTFFTHNYLNLFVIKLSFLVCNFQISFFLNAFFYTEEYISDAYHNDGVLDFFSGLPKSIYSLLVTMILTNLLNMLSNSKSDLMYIIREKNNNKNYLYIVNRKLKQIRTKLIIYFILVFLLGTLFLYYVCSFCSVYRYSQKYWFFGSLESFAMDFLVAVIFCLFLALFRYLAIKKHLKCFYIIANIISNLV